MAEISNSDLDEPAAGGGSTQITAADLDPEEKPGFFRRAYESVKAGGRAIGHVASDVGSHVAEGFKHPIYSLIHPVEFASTSPIADPAKRREFERGVDDVVTLGYGQKLAARVGNALGDQPDVALGPETFGSAQPGQTFAGPGAPVANTQAADAAAAPDYRTVGQITGSALPGATSAIGKAGGAVVGKIGSKLAPAATAAIEKVASVPVVGKALAPVAAGAVGAGKSIVGYEASAPLTAALSAGAEGHRHEAAHAAATDPTGLITSAVLGGVPAAAGETGKQIQRYVAEAPKKADDWLVNDIRGRYKGESTATARKYLANDEADVVATVRSDPKLGEALADARHSDRAKLEKASEAVQSKIDEVNAPRTALYNHVNEALDGGIKSGDFIRDLQTEAADLRKGGTPGGHKMARWIDGRIEELQHSSDWGGGESAFNPEKPVSGGALDGMKTGDAVALLERQRGHAAPSDHAAIDGEIDRIREAATTRGFNAEKRVPAQTVRRFVSDVQDAAYDGLGGLQDTRAAGQSREIAGRTLGIFNRYLDRAAAVTPEAGEAVPQIRAINTQHSALKNIQRVIDQRLEKAVEGAHGSGGPMNARNALRAMTHGSVGLMALEAAAHGRPGLAAGILAVNAAPAIKRLADTQAAKIANSPAYAAAILKVAKLARSGIKARDFVQQAVNAGLPIADARRIAEAAGAP